MAPVPAGNEITVATYNILADVYIDPARYPRSDANALAPKNRHPKLVDRVVGFDADVICLQEVDLSMYNLLESRLAPLGHESFWHVKGPGKRDGCATFIRKPLVEVGSRVLRYGQESSKSVGHVAIISVVERSGHLFIIANTHLKWDPPGTPRDQQWGLRQARELLAEVRHRPAIDFRHNPGILNLKQNFTGNAPRIRCPHIP